MTTGGRSARGTVRHEADGLLIPPPSEVAARRDNSFTPGI